MPYCTHDDVLTLFGDISDDISTDMLDKVIDNSTVWIDHKLTQNNIPIPKPNNTIAILKTIATYYSACQILTSLYHGDEMPENSNFWCIEARTLMEEYIIGYWDDEDNLDKVNHQMVKHSKAKTYNQKRGRRSVRGWVR